MNLSIKAATQLGERFARSLHLAGTDTVKRGAIINVKEDVLSEIYKGDTRTAFKKSYAETLDKLEPLQGGPHSRGY